MGKFNITCFLSTDEREISPSLYNNGAGSLGEEVHGEINFPTPREMKEHLDKYIIGQDQAKKMVCVGVYNRHIRQLNNDYIYRFGLKDEQIEKSNILLIGPTGSGKTYMINKLAEFLDIPFVIEDVTSLTKNGYVGRDIEDSLVALIRKAIHIVQTKHNIHPGHGEIYTEMVRKLAENGIIFFDEIDKITIVHEHRDRISSSGLQEEMLKLLEGTVHRLDDRVYSNSKSNRDIGISELSTHNILFIGGGAFPDLPNIVDKRLNPNSIGFSHKISTKKEKLEHLHKTVPQDLINYGLMPEFVGRFPLIAAIDKLTEKDLLTILTSATNSLIQQHERHFRWLGIEIKFTRKALKKIVKEAAKLGIGARGLRTIIDKALVAHQYHSPDNLFGNEIVIKEKDIE